MELIKACYEIRALRGRRELGLALNSGEQLRLGQLEQLFGQAEDPAVVAGGGRRARGRRRGGHVARRFEVRVAVTLKVGGRAGEGCLTNLSAEGAFIETTTPASSGDEMMLRIADLATQCQYHFVGQVVRTARRGVAIRLLGIPVECRFLQTSTSARRAA
jgi:hypothetical protein